MLYKEFFSALVMTAIIVCFAVPLTHLEGESQVVPLLLLICMGVFNVGQYILAGLRHAAKMDVKMSLKGYPLWRVLTLIAQPMEVTLKGAAKRILICFLCIAFLYCLFTVLLAVQIPKGILGI